MSLSLYSGEFLVSPYPLELSLNYCSHKCLYCFANLNKPNRRADIKAILNYLARLDEKSEKDIVAYLLKSKYPVLISNKVDPFAYSNYQQAIKIIEILSSLEIPVAFQTKGGNGIDEVLQMINPSAWYISISFVDDELRKKIEPASPPLKSRFELIEKLLAAGHYVQVGINPLVEEWIGDYRFLVDKLYNLGVRDIWAEALHFNRDQVANMGELELTAMGKDFISKAMKRRHPDSVLSLLFRLEEYITNKGMNYYHIGMPKKTNYYDNARKLYKKTFPIYSDLVNFLFDNDFQPDEVISFDEFYQILGNGLPKGRYNIGTYLGSTTRQVFWEKRVPNVMSYKDLLKIIYNDPRTKQNPVRWFCFAYASIIENGEQFELVDEGKNRYLTFHKGLINSFYHIIKEA